MAHWQRSERLSVEAAERMWSEHPTWNYGARMGLEDRLVCVDVDDTSVFETLCDRYGPLPTTLTATTGRGKHYYLVLHPGDRMVGNRVGLGGLKGVDVRARGGQVLLPPSRHVSGRVYAWEHITDPAECPAAWIQLFSAAQSVDKPLSRTTVKETSAKIAKRHKPRHGLAWPDLARALVCLADGMPYAAEGKRDETCWDIVRLLAEEYPQADARTVEDLFAASHSHSDGWPGDVGAKWLRATAERREATRLPIVDVDKGDTGAQADRLIGLLRADPELYQREGAIVHVWANGAGALRIAETETELIRDRISRIAACMLESRGGRIVIPPPHAIANVVLARRSYGMRELIGVTEIPILRPDGSICTEEGFHDGWLYRPSVEVTVPEHPTQADAAIALRTLREPFSEAPLEGLGRDVLVSIILSVVGRTAITGPVPLYGLDATRAGSGKTLACDFISLVALGRRVQIATLSAREEEREKALIGAARQGSRLLVLDNQADAVSSPMLDRVATATELEFRPFGRNDASLTCPWRGVIIVNGNGLSANVLGDTRRRMIVARLVPQSDNPAGLSFAISAEEWRALLVSERGRWLSAAYTLLVAHAGAGRPCRTAKPVGDFGAWRSVVADAIAWAGGGDLSTATLDLEPDEDEREERIIFDAIARHPGAARDIVRTLAAGGVNGFAFADAEALELLTRAVLPAELNASSLGRWLRGRRDKIVQGRRLASREITGITRWEVV